MDNLAQEFEELNFWETTTEEENFLIYGMDFPETNNYILITDENGKTLTDYDKIIVVACYDENECFLWGKELKNFASLKELVEKFKPETNELLEKIKAYKFPKE